jgi:hypothetical protein
MGFCKKCCCLQGQLVNDMRYLASVVTQCFTAFGELLALNKRFAELTGGVTRCGALLRPIATAASPAYCLLVPSGRKERVSLGISGAQGIVLAVASSVAIGTLRTLEYDAVRETKDAELHPQRR